MIVRSGIHNTYNAIPGDMGAGRLEDDDDALPPDTADDDEGLDVDAETF